MREANWIRLVSLSHKTGGNLHPLSTHIPKKSTLNLRLQIVHVLPNGRTKRGRLSFATFASTHLQQWPAGATNRFPSPRSQRIIVSFLLKKDDIFILILLHNQKVNVDVSRALSLYSHCLTYFFT